MLWYLSVSDLYLAPDDNVAQLTMPPTAWWELRQPIDLDLQGRKRNIVGRALGRKLVVPG
jgi:hypothetical protein